MPLREEGQKGRIFELCEKVGMKVDGEREYYSIPDIIFSYSSHQGTWSSCFAASIM